MNRNGDCMACFGGVHFRSQSSMFPETRNKGAGLGDWWGGGEGGRVLQALCSRGSV